MAVADAAVRTQLRVSFRLAPNEAVFAPTILTWIVLTAIAGVGVLHAAADRTSEPGHGTLAVGETQFPFRVVRCELNDTPDASGYVYELYALARGRVGNDPFFVEVERGRRGSQQQAAIHFYWTDLPTGWWHGGLSPGGEHIDELDRVRRAGGYESMSRWGLFPDQLLARGRRVYTVGSVRFLRMRDGNADANAGFGTLSLTCSE